MKLYMWFFIICVILSFLLLFIYFDMIYTDFQIGSGILLQIIQYTVLHRLGVLAYLE